MDGAEALEMEALHAAGAIGDCFRELRRCFIVSHARRITRARDRRIMGRPGTSETLCGAECTEFDVLERDAQRRPGSIGCDACRAELAPFRVRYLARCPSRGCGTRTNTAGPVGQWCIEHKAVLRSTTFKARQTATACEAICQRALGGDCSCSCGGANHGVSA